MQSARREVGRLGTAFHSRGRVQDAGQAGVEWRSRATARKNTASASSLNAMARPTRIGRPRKSPPPVFFKLIAVGLRPIDRHPTPACAAVYAARRWPSGLERILLNHVSDATHSRAGNRIVSVGTA